MIEIRKLQVKDLPQLAELYEELVGEKSDAVKMQGTFARIQADEHYYLLGAFEGEILAGSVMGILCHDLIGECRPFMVVENVIVSDRFRGKKVGRLLMEDLELLAVQQRCGYAILVSSGFRSEAHAFYESLGYTEDVRGFRRRLEP
ncbi:GNAT family N-acetyltransferase [Saccharibacillus sp. O16]|nr:GNAT family N-acetyltransferase [Saccharibacillus sp. O16]